MKIDNENSMIHENDKKKEKKKKEYRLIYRKFADKWVTAYHMKKPKRKPKTVDEYNERIYFAVANDQLNKAIHILRDMERAKEVQPDLRSYTMIVNGFCIQSDMIKAKKWVKRLRQNGLRPDVYVYTSLIDGYMRTSNVDQTENVFKLMMSYNIKPNLVTYNVLMHHSILKLDIEAAVQFWNKLLKVGLKPDVYTYAIMIHGLGGSQLVDEAWRMFEKMKKDNIDINHVVATTLMGIHVKHRDNAYAIQLFKQIFKNSSNLQSTILPTQHTHNVLLNAVLGNAELDKIKLYYQQFQSFLDFKQDQHASVSPSSISSSPSSVSSSSSSSPNSYSILFGQQEKISNSAYTYTTFMRAFLRRDDIGMVSQVYQDMISRSVKPTVVTYSILMLAHAFVPDPEACENILNELKKHHIEVNTALYTIVMRAWAKAKNWDQVKRVYKEMKNNQLEPNKMTMEVLNWAKKRTIPPGL
ncbi:unnamed protein product [Cunninghamella blakesleeana]